MKAQVIYKMASRLVCALAFISPVFSYQIPERLPADRERNYDTESFRNPVNHLYICLFTDSSGSPKSDSFLELREGPRKRVIASLRCDWKPGFAALWSPDGKHVAVSYKDMESGATKTTLYAVSSASLIEIPAPEGLQLKSLLAKGDPARGLLKYAETTIPNHWINNVTLEYKVSGVFRDVKSGFTNVAYKVTTKLRSESSLEIVSSVRTEYRKDN